MAGKFVIQKDKAGQFRFNLKASNGEVMLSSEESVSSRVRKAVFQQARKYLVWLG